LYYLIWTRELWERGLEFWSG